MKSYCENTKKKQQLRAPSTYDENDFWRRRRIRKHFELKDIKQIQETILNVMKILTNIWHLNH